MLLQIKNVFFRYPGQDYWCLNDISLALEKGMTFGVLGTSGSGKSTLGKLATGLVRPSKGRVLFHDEVFAALPKRGRNRTKIQMIFQNPEVSFDPTLTLESSMSEAYRISGKKYTFAALCEMAESFGIYPGQLKRKPAQLSGGELQRLAIARALLSEPEVLVLDEATTMLDVITQAQIMKMLKGIQKDMELAYLFITHDRLLARMMCDEIIEIENGVGEKSAHREYVPSDKPFGKVAMHPA